MPSASKAGSAAANGGRKPRGHRPPPAGKRLPLQTLDRRPKAREPTRVSDPRPEYDLEAWRRRIPPLASCIPMNNRSQAPHTAITRAAATRYLDSWNARGMDWDAWIEEVGQAKAAF